jgi:hypothetical protein
VLHPREERDNQLLVKILQKRLKAKGFDITQLARGRTSMSCDW